MRLFSAATAAVICAFTSGCAALAFSPSVAGTDVSNVSSAKQWLKQLLIESLWSFALLRDGIYAHQCITHDG
ncbi:Uncharacterised protein [Escherichia coli]|nr:Uncharacterised protein [Escherichia coli]